MSGKLPGVRQLSTAGLTLLLLASHISQLEGQRRRRVPDPRLDYDVQHYGLNMRVRPDSQHIEGTCTVRLRVTAAQVDSLVLDAAQQIQIDSVWLLESSTPLDFKHSGDRLAISAPETLRYGELYSVAINYVARPTSPGIFLGSGLGFSQTEHGQPWVATSCQIPGAHWWWPCKASFFHPEDKPDSVRLAITVPDTLMAISNGRFLGTYAAEPGWTTYRWSYSHPILTYLVAIYVGPYTELTQEIFLPDHPQPLVAHYYVLKEQEARAQAEFFPTVPELLRCYERWFGPFAFADNKFGLVQSPYPGMEHSTAVAVGPVFPNTLKPGENNPLSPWSQYFNYMLVHETAHEWWGNAVSALDWGEFWLHEGFATYAEALWMEHRFGKEAMHEYMARLSFRIDSTVTIYRPRHNDAGEAYHLNIYFKGAWVLHMLRYVMGDTAFFAALREFNTNPRFRYANATTADFQRVCERIYGGDLSWFFLEWIYRPGWPHFTLDWQASGRTISIGVNDTCYFRTLFRMPLDILLRTSAGEEKHRLWLKPGRNRFEITAKAEVRDVAFPGLRWILDGRKRGTLSYFGAIDFVKGAFVDSLVFTEDRQLFVADAKAAWESPPRSLFDGAKWKSLRLDTTMDARYRQVKMTVREYKFRKKERKPWQPLGPDGQVPEELAAVRRLQYRLDFGALVGEKLPIPRVVVEYE